MAVSGSFPVPATENGGGKESLPSDMPRSMFWLISRMKYIPPAWSAFKQQPSQLSLPGQTEHPRGLRTESYPFKEVGYVCS